VPVVARLLKDSDSEIKRMAAETIFGSYPDEPKRLGVCELFLQNLLPHQRVIHAIDASDSRHQPETSETSGFLDY
jgi:hypothetical protein